METALVGHRRIAVDDPKLQLGLPELTLGLIPGATGITKFTRLLGLMGAQPYVMESKLFGPREALEIGIVHELVVTADELRPRALAWIAEHLQAAHPWDAKDYKLLGTPANPKIAGALTVRRHAEGEDARPLPRASRPRRRRWSKARRWITTPPPASRAATSPA